MTAMDRRARAGVETLRSLAAPRVSIDGDWREGICWRMRLIGTTPSALAARQRTLVRTFTRYVQCVQSF
jgi:hypothetical protein